MASLCSFVLLALGLCLVPALAMDAAEAAALRAGVRTVHVIYMTHLDVGYTDTEKNVEELYFNQWYPKAIATAEALKQRRGEERFIWTTHPWLLTEYLRNGTAAQIAAVEAAIAAGDIQWQAGPFNLQTENMDSSLFSYSLSLSAQLDERFNKTKKTGASQKDVPGATRGIVPLMHKAGIGFFHVGANDESTPPSVPVTSPSGTICNTFLWRDKNTWTELVTAWCNGYCHQPIGITPEMEVIVPGFSDALVWLMMIDNSGPQNVSQVLTGWANIRALYPNATIIASSLEAFEARIVKAKPLLPVFEGEIGDTWIYGVSADPAKTRVFRELSRQRAAALQLNASLLTDPGFMEFSRLLAKLPEHTWGLHNLMEYNMNWTNVEFDGMKGQDSVVMNQFSWTEQRWFADRALEALSSSPQLQSQFAAAVAATYPYEPDLSGYDPISLSSLAHKEFSTWAFLLSFNASTGAINSLIDTRSGRIWATVANPLAYLHYMTFSEAHMQTFTGAYNMCPLYCNSPDFGKPGMPVNQTLNWDPNLLEAYLHSSGQTTSFFFNMTLPALAHLQYGAPAIVYLNVTVPAPSNNTDRTLLVEVQWFGKTATRLAEATFLSFVPVTSNPRGWMMDKLGLSISPYEVCVNGSRALHAVWSGISYFEDTKMKLGIETLDAPLVAPGNATLLVFDNSQPACELGMHFNLHNNLWNTNYPVWYSDDERFRFALTFH